VHWIRRCAWFLASILLGLSAIALDWYAKSFVSAGVVGIAAATHARSEGATSETIAAMKELAIAHVHRGAGWGTVGLMVVVASTLCFFFSRMRSEPGPRLAPVAVWIVYGFSCLVTV
jgi:hypothetical protein